MAAGRDKINRMRQNGVHPDDIQTWVADKRRRFIENGVALSDQDAYFGTTEPVMKAERGFVREGMEQAEPQKIADNPFEMIDAGLQMSATGLYLRGGLPDTVLPEDAGLYAKMLSAVGTAAGDLPAIVLGALGGAPAGPVGAFAGSAALPEFLRSAMMDHYEAAQNGDGLIFTSDDMFSRMGGIIWDTAKGAGAGAVAGRAGVAVAGGFARAGVTGAPAVLSRGVTEATAFTGTFSGLNGEVPDLDDFVVGAALVVGVHGSVKAAKKVNPATIRQVSRNMMEIYRRTGIKPKDQASMAAEDKAFLNEILSNNPDGLPSTEAFGKRKLPEPEPHIKPKEGEPVPPAEPKAKKAEEVDTGLSADEQVVADQIAPKPTTKEKLQDVVAKFDPEKIYAETVRDFRVLELMEKEIKKAGGIFDVSEHTPSQAARQTLGSQGRAGHFIRFGGLDFAKHEPTGNPSYMSAVAIAKQKGGTLEGLTLYRLSKYTLERGKRGIETGIPIDVAGRVVKEGNTKYLEAEKAINQVKNDVLKYVEDSGILSAKAVKDITALNEAHIPTKRLLGDKTPDAPTKLGRSLKVVNPIRRATGSKELIIDPVGTEINNIHNYIALADRQKVMDTIVTNIEKLQKTNPDSAALIAGKSKKKLTTTKLEQKEVTNLLEELGLGKDEAKALAGSIEPFTIFRRAQKQLGPNEALFFRKGKPEVWEFRDADVAKLLRGADPWEAGLMIQVATKVAGVKRSGLIGTPDFPIRNTFRDLIQAAVVTEGFNPATEFPKGFMQVMGKGPEYQRWIAKGGSGTSIASMDTNYVQRDINTLFQKTGVTKRVLNEVSHPIELMRKFTEIMDASGRVGALASFKKRGIPDPQAVEMSRTMMLDFMQRGSSQMINTFARVTPFFRPALLEIEQITRAINKNPVAFGMKATAYITAPTMGLYFINMAIDEATKGDPKRVPYRDQPRWIRDLYWNVPVWTAASGWFFLRMPKPRALGLMFGALPERFADDLLRNDPRAWKEFSKTAMGTLIPPFIPAIIEPIASVATGKNFFTGNPNTPSSLEDNTAHMQYTPNTSELSKRLSKILYTGLGSNLSPINIDVLVRGFSGTLGIEAIKLLDGALPGPTRPDKSFYEMPFIKSFFVRNSGTRTQTITDFYDKIDAMRTRRDDLRLAVSRLSKEELRLAAGERGAFIKVEKAAQAVSSISAIIRLVNDHPTMDGAKKREFIDSLGILMWKVAKTHLKILDTLVPPGEE